MWRFIEPNKPIRTNEDFLSEINDEYIADIKLDGWRLIINNFDSVNFISRKNEIFNDIPNKLKSYFENNLPKNMAVDAEWINKSRIKAINTTHGFNIPIIDCIVIFDITWVDGKYTNLPLRQRRNIDFYKNLQTIDLDNIIDGGVFKIDSVSGNKALSFYNKQKSQPLSEGIVVKRKDGNQDSNWYKVKYRK